MSETIAVYGGSFDPPHLAHTLVAAYVLASERVDRVLVVPTASHAFGKPLTGFDERVAMCRLAMTDLARVEVSELERALPPPTYTLHMLQALVLQLPTAKLRLVMGSDLLAETHAWHDFASIEKLAPPIVVQRAGHAQPGATQPALPELSSSEVRRRLYAGESTQGFLSPRVAEHIAQRGLYRTR